MATSKTLTPTNVTIQIPEFTDQPDQRVNSNCIDKEADAINALNSKISKIGTSAVQLWNGNLMLDDEVTLSESMANFNFILLHFLTNSEHSYQLVPSSNFVGGEVISQTIMANSSSGQVSYPLAYNSSIQVKATSATKVKCIASNYNNVNYIVKLRNVYGVMRIS